MRVITQYNLDTLDDILELNGKFGEAVVTITALAGNHVQLRVHYPDAPEEIEVAPFLKLCTKELIRLALVDKGIWDPTVGVDV